MLTGQIRRGKGANLWLNCDGSMSVGVRTVVDTAWRVSGQGENGPVRG